MGKNEAIGVSDSRVNAAPNPQNFHPNPQNVYPKPQNATQNMPSSNNPLNGLLCKLGYDPKDVVSGKFSG